LISAKLNQPVVTAFVKKSSSKGISQEIAKQITKLIRDEFKRSSSIQGDAVRVSSKDKDDLKLLSTPEEDFPLHCNLLIIVK